MNATPDFLSRIIERKRVRLARAMDERGLEELRADAVRVRGGAKPHALRAALARDGRFQIIAEIKRASPSLGDICREVSPSALAREYEAGGAAAISVLTEEDHFKGSLDDLREVRESTSLPLLRKDFIFDEWQIYEAAAARADALLLIVAALGDGTLARLRSIAEDELGMDALVEVHTAEELRRAARCGAKIIGVNNRNLHNFEVSLETSVELVAEAPPGALLVSESGLSTNADLRRLQSLGYRGFLIGEKLMRANDPAQALRSLLGEESYAG
ncbi:MAG TPA: indole-3-glycerol phosphate synthase TrpC [Pyrinomonadaceae bacterium]|nr:indole-3-glycerol phosphate synthase TrpC [Pyrinomonadaceae bacterium]